MQIEIKRLWGIRHVRWLWLFWRVHSFARQCASIGLGLGHPNESDLRVLDAIWRGDDVGI
jgi:hypothetical protein